MDMLSEYGYAQSIPTSSRYTDTLRYTNTFRVLKNAQGTRTSSVNSDTLKENRHAQRTSLSEGDTETLSGH